MSILKQQQNDEMEHEKGGRGVFTRLLFFLAFRFVPFWCCWYCFWFLFSSLLFRSQPLSFLL